MIEGKHLLLDMFGLPAPILQDTDALIDVLCAAVAATGLHAVAEPTVVRFNTRGQGATGFIPLAESHVAFHSYPEFGYLAIDLFTCGVADIGAAQRVFAETLNPERSVTRLCQRGLADPG